MNAVSHDMQKLDCVTSAMCWCTALGDFIFPLKPSFKLGFKPNFGLKPN